MDRVGGRAVGRTVLLVLMAVVTARADAADRFIDTRDLTRHRGDELPVVPKWIEALTRAPTFPFRHYHTNAWDPATEAVAGKLSPLSVMAGYTGAAQITSAGMKAGAKVGDTAAGAAFRSDKANDFFDGKGNRIDFDYERDTEHLVLRHGRPEATMLSFGMARDVFESGELPNYAVDVNRLEQGGARVALDHRPASGWFDSMHFEASAGEVTIDTDNFTQRRPNPSAKLHIPIQHAARRAAATLVRQRDGSRTELGADFTYTMYDSKRESFDQGAGPISAYRIPWTEAVWGGLSAAHRASFGDLSIEGGLRYDVISNTAQDVHKIPQIGGAAGAVYDFSAQELYRRTYGVTDNDSIEHNVSGRLRAEQAFDDGAGWLDLSRLVRSADHGERWYALSGTAALFQVGNPQLDPEQHHKAELGGRLDGGGFKGYGHASKAGAWRLTGMLGNDWIEDFIAVDRARGQVGVLRTTGGVVYRNVDAVMTSVGANLDYMLLDQLGLRLNLTGAHGRNITDHRPLYQVSPFEANTYVDWFGGDQELGWNLGLHLRAVAAKRDVDASITTGSGMDFGGSAGGYATFDVYGGLRVGSNLALTAGVENLLDKLYREHISGTPQTPITTNPNAPGRTVFARAVASF